MVICYNRVTLLMNKCLSIISANNPDIGLSLTANVQTRCVFIFVSVLIRHVVIAEIKLGFGFGSFSFISLLIFHY